MKLIKQKLKCLFPRFPRGEGLQIENVRPQASLLQVLQEDSKFMARRDDSER